MRLQLDKIFEFEIKFESLIALYRNYENNNSTGRYKSDQAFFATGCKISQKCKLPHGLLIHPDWHLTHANPPVVSVLSRSRKSEFGHVCIKSKMI